jgi:hypothetical protein
MRTFTFARRTESGLQAHPLFFNKLQTFFACLTKLPNQNSPKENKERKGLRQKKRTPEADLKGPEGLLFLSSFIALFE